MKRILTYVSAVLLLAACSAEKPPQDPPPDQHFAGEWIVSAVEGNDLRIYRIPGDSPGIGQRVRISFPMPGVDETVSRAEGGISKFDDETITVSVDPSTQTGMPQPGDRVTQFTSE